MSMSLCLCVFVSVVAMGAWGGVVAQKKYFFRILNQSSDKHFLGFFEENNFLLKNNFFLKNFK